MEATTTEPTPASAPETPSPAAINEGQNLAPPIAPTPTSKPRKAKQKLTTQAAQDFAATITSRVLSGKDIPGTQDSEATRWPNGMSRSTRAHLGQIIGPSVDDFRALLSDLLIGAAHYCADLIVRDLDTQKPETRAFTLCALTDKSEQLRGKLSSNPGTAAVNVQVNIGADPALRTQLLASLSSNGPTVRTQQANNEGNTAGVIPVTPAVIPPVIAPVITPVIHSSSHQSHS